MMRLPGGLVLFVVVAAVVAGCGGGERYMSASSTAPSATRSFHSWRWGYDVTFPRAWRRAEHPVSRLLDPREILSLATFSVRHRPTNCDAFAGSAREVLGTTDVFLTVLERGYDASSQWLDFPPRPARFRPSPANLQAPEPACGDRAGTEVRWFNFTDSGRHFHVLMVIGPDAAPAARADAWRVLNSLRFDPGMKPNWPASG